MTNTIKFAAYGYAMAEQDADGNWQVPAPTSVSDGEWGTFRIEAGATWNTSGTAVASLGTAGTDITTVNGVPTLIDSLSFGEPYGETTGQITLPEVTVFDDPAAIGCAPGANIDIYRVLPAAEATAAGVDEVPYWHGIIASAEISDGPGITTSISLQLMGALYGEASLRMHQPLMLDTSSDVGTWVGRALDYDLYSRPFTPFTRFTFESDTTSINTRYRGSRGQSTIDYLDELMTLAQDATHGQWTISRAYQSLGGRDYPRARHYYLRTKPQSMGTAIQQNTVFAGGYGVSLSLTRDFTESPNVIYGEGVHPVDSSDLAGSRWRNAKYPMLHTSAPANPSRISGSTYPIEIGDTDADFTAPVITQLNAQLRVSGWPDVQLGDEFTADTETAIVALKEDTGYANTNANIGGTAEWAYVWSTGSGYTDLSSGFMLPLAWDTEVEKYTYAPDGDVSGTNGSYDPSVLRVERIISYGEGVSKAKARKNARRLVNTTTPPIIGTITLMADPTDENGDGRSRLDIREGSWIQVNNLYDSDTASQYVQFYVAGVQQSPESDGFPTTLTVTTEPYDLLDLATRLERQRDAKDNPAKSFYSQRTKAVRPFRQTTGWDAESGAGVITPRTLTADTWNIIRFVGAQYGSIGSLVAQTSGTACKFSMAIFGGSVSSGALGSAIANPLGTVTGDYPSWFQHPDNLPEMEQWGLVEAWGSFGEAAGYYPGAESIGTAAGSAGSVTGKLEDAGSWTFASLDPPFLYAAVYPTEGCTFSATMRIVADE